jgi:hypothetical protein
LFLLAVSILVPVFKPFYAGVVILASFLGQVTFWTWESFDAVVVGNGVDPFVCFVRQIDGFKVKDFAVTQSFSGAYQLP